MSEFDSKTQPMQDEAVFWQELAKGEVLAFRARGRSMLPLYRSGTLFLIQRTEPTALRIGDLVLCKYGDDVRLHRLLGRTEDNPPKLFTKGDWLSEVDAPWTQDCVQGRAIAVQFRGRFISLQGALQNRMKPLSATLSLFSAPLLSAMRKLSRRLLPSRWD